LLLYHNLLFVLLFVRSGLFFWSALLAFRVIFGILLLISVVKLKDFLFLLLGWLL